MSELAKPTHIIELREVLIALIKHKGLHKGYWTLGVEFGFGAGNFGPSKDNAFPSAFAQVQKLGLTEADAEGPLAIDAEKVNPTTKRAAKAKKTP